MMDFEGKEQILQQVQQGQTLLNVVQQLQQQLAMFQAAAGMNVEQPGYQSQTGQGGGGPTIAQARQDAINANKKSYGERLAERSRA